MNWIKNLITRIRSEIHYRKKLKSIRKKKPFIYF